MLVFIALVSKYLRDKRVTPIVIRAISVEEINDKYPVAPYDSALSLCESCSICLESFKENDEIRKLFCYHIYHVKCIDT